MAMSYAIIILTLLLSATAFESWEPLEGQTEERLLEQKSVDKRRPNNEEEERLQQTERSIFKILQMTAFPGSCPACKMVVNWIKKRAGNESSKQKIRELLKKVCSNLKSVVKVPCREIVKTYGNKLVHAMTKGTPATVCARMKLCKKSRAVFRVYK